MIPLLLGLIGYAASGSLLGVMSLLVLYACWLLLYRVQGPPILFLALAYHWMQTSLGVFYGPITGRDLLATTAPQYHVMVTIALGCVLAHAVGIRVGVACMSRQCPERTASDPVFTFKTLVAAYLAAFFVTGALQSMAWSYPLFTQPMVASTTIRLGLFYFCVRRLLIPAVRPVPLLALLGFEIVIGMSGFFASFREPVLFAGIAFVEAFDRRRVAHWLGMAALVAIAGCASLFWMGVRGEYRQDFTNVEMFAESRALRLQRLRQLGREWSRQDRQEMLWTLDFLVDRLWAVYYPALALDRVPAVVPHENGAILWRAIQHIAMPRVLFPNKQAPGSDSDLVRRYSGVAVAGVESDTSIAFGYAAESYVDFGLPGMFVPVLLWGVFVGAAYQFLCFLIRHEELRIPLLVVVFWMSLSQFERSWAKTMGLTGTLLIYLGGFTYLVDRWLIQRYVTHVKPIDLMASATAEQASR